MLMIPTPMKLLTKILACAVFLLAAVPALVRPWRQTPLDGVQSCYSRVTCPEYQVIPTDGRAAAHSKNLWNSIWTGHAENMGPPYPDRWPTTPTPLIAGRCDLET